MTAPKPSTETAKMQRIADDAVAKQQGHRRSSDDAQEHWLRLKWSLILGSAIFAAGVGLRIAHLIGEATLVAFVFLAGVVVKGESIIGLVRASKKGNDTTSSPPAA